MVDEFFPIFIPLSDRALPVRNEVVGRRLFLRELREVFLGEQPVFPL